LYAMRDRARGRLAAKSAASDKKAIRPAIGSRRPAAKAKDGNQSRIGAARSRTPSPPHLPLDEMPSDSARSSQHGGNGSQRPANGRPPANGMAARQKLREKGKGDSQPSRANSDGPYGATAASSRASRSKPLESDRMSSPPARLPRPERLETDESSCTGTPAPGRLPSPSSMHAPGRGPRGQQISAPPLDSHSSTAPGAASQISPVSQVVPSAQASSSTITGGQTGGGWFGFGGGGGGGGSDSRSALSDNDGGWFGFSRSEPHPPSSSVCAQAVDAEMRSNDASVGTNANSSSCDPPRIALEGGTAALQEDPKLLRPKARGASPNRARTGTATVNSHQRRASSDRPAAARGPGRGNSYSSQHRSPQSPQAKVRPGPPSTRTGNTARVHAPPTRDMEVSETPRGIAVLEWQQQRAGGERGRHLNRSPTLKTWDYHPAGEPEGMERRERAIMRLTS